MSNNLILILAIIIAFAVILLLIVRRFIKNEIIDNNDFIMKFRELGKTDPFISGILEKSGCDEQSLPLYDLKTIKNLRRYLRKINPKKEAFIELLDMPCTKLMDADEIINRYIWCKGHGVKNCEKCIKNKPIEFQPFNQEGYTGNLFDNSCNPYW